MVRGSVVKIENGLYHLMTRTVDRDFFFGDGEREQLRKMIGAFGLASLRDTVFLVGYPVVAPAWRGLTTG